jgi:hypothetical protein
MMYESATMLFLPGMVAWNLPAETKVAAARAEMMAVIFIVVSVLLL